MSAHWLYGEDGIEGEEYPDRSPRRQVSAREQAWWVALTTHGAFKAGKCPAYWNGWTCTLRVGHPGLHVAGLNDRTCSARWSTEPSMHDIDCGDDEGC